MSTQSILVPTPPLSPRRIAVWVEGGSGGSGSAASTPRSSHSSAAPSPSHAARSTSSSMSGGGRRESINAARRRSLLVASQLNALVFPGKGPAPAADTQLRLHDVDADKGDGNDMTIKTSEEDVTVPNDPREPRPSNVATTNAGGVEPRGSFALPISKPLSGVALRVRRNSWVQRDEPLGGADAVFRPAEPAESTPVQRLRPGEAPVDEVAPAEGSSTAAEASPVQETLLTGPMSRDGAHPLFATPAAAAKYSRMLRRASWPLLVPDIGDLLPDGARTKGGDANDAAVTESSRPSHQGSYLPTPATSPRQGAVRLAERGLAADQQLRDTSFESSSDFTAAGGDISFNDVEFVHSASVLTTAAAVAAAAPPPSPLVNLLLLGDDSCGLGVALDEFAGRDRNVGITFKTRKIVLHSRENGEGQEEEEEYRVRCWHTPGLAPSNAHNLGPYLRRVQAIALVYDVTDRNSFQACVAWFDRLVAHLESRAASHTAQGRGVPLVLLANEATLKSRHAAKRRDVAPVSGQSAAGVMGNMPPPAPSRAVARRSSLPHAHLPHHTGSDSGSSGIGSATVSSAAPSSSSSSTSDPHAGRAVSRSEESAFVSRLESQYGRCGFGPVSSLSLNANLWRDRYRAFQRVAALVQQIGTAQQHSRPVSPVHANSAAHSRNNSASDREPGFGAS